MSDEEWMQRFESASLPNESFHHADHVKMAFLYLQKYAALEALRRFTFALKHFAAAHGQADRYHETITWGFLLLVRERLARVDGQQTWEEFAAQNPDLLQWNDHALKKYYRSETLSSALARQIFVFPDVGTDHRP